MSGTIDLEVVQTLLEKVASLEKQMLYMLGKINSMDISVNFIQQNIRPKEVNIKTASEVYLVSRTKIYEDIERGLISKNENNKLDVSKLDTIYGSKILKNQQNKEKSTVTILS